MGEPLAGPHPPGADRPADDHRRAGLYPAVRSQPAERVGHELRRAEQSRDPRPQSRGAARQLRPQYGGGRHQPVPPGARRRPDLADRDGVFRLPHARWRLRAGAVSGKGRPAVRQDDRDQAVAGRQAGPRRHSARGESLARNRAHPRGAARPRRDLPTRPCHVFDAGRAVGVRRAPPGVGGRQTGRDQAVRGQAARVPGDLQSHAAHGHPARLHQRGRCGGRHRSRAARVFGPYRLSADRKSDLRAQRPGRLCVARPRYGDRQRQDHVRLPHGEAAGAGCGRVQFGARNDDGAGLHSGAALQLQHLPDGRGHPESAPRRRSGSRGEKRAGRQFPP